MNATFFLLRFRLHSINSISLCYSKFSANLNVNIWSPSDMNYFINKLVMSILLLIWWKFNAILSTKCNAMQTPNLFAYMCVTKNPFKCIGLCAMEYFCARCRRRVHSWDISTSYICSKYGKFALKCSWRIELGLRYQSITTDG